MMERVRQMTMLYLRLKRNIQAHNSELIRLEDIAYLSSEQAILQNIAPLILHQIRKSDAEYVVIDRFHIIQVIQQYNPHITVDISGPEESIIQVHANHKQAPVLLISFVWLVLFIGAAMTIINFHYDVSMQEVHQKIHFFLTGKNEKYPLLIQIPYSLGLGVGMILFLNHWFKKRFNEEPSPLELELFQYKRDINDYIAHHENDLNDDHRL